MGNVRPDGRTNRRSHAGFIYFPQQLQEKNNNFFVVNRRLQLPLGELQPDIFIIATHAYIPLQMLIPH